MWKKIAAMASVVLVGLGALWFAIFSLTPYAVNDQQLKKKYSYPAVAINMQLTEESSNLYSFTYTSFDGVEVNGRLSYPDEVPLEEFGAGKLPIMIGIHGMGRSDNRWFMDSFKGRPTVEQTHKLTEQARAAGYAIIAIDGRNHGKRKDPDYSISNMMRDLHLWGKREPYEAMVVDTVKDYRVLLDWIGLQPQFDQARTAVAGYSLGGQVALLLAGVDERIEQVLSIVPPYHDDKTALVAPKNLVHNITDEKVWLVTASDDEYASVEDNKYLFGKIASGNKKHIQLEGEHILPEGYYQALSGWYE